MLTLYGNPQTYTEQSSLSVNFNTPFLQLLFFQFDTSTIITIHWKFLALFGEQFA